MLYAIIWLLLISGAWSSKQIIDVETLLLGKLVESEFGITPESLNDQAPQLLSLKSGLEERLLRILSAEINKKIKKQDAAILAALMSGASPDESLDYVIKARGEDYPRFNIADLDLSLKDLLQKISEDEIFVWGDEELKAVTKLIELMECKSKLIIENSYCLYLEALVNFISTDGKIDQQKLSENVLNTPKVARFFRYPQYGHLAAPEMEQLLAAEKYAKEYAEKHSEKYTKAYAEFYAKFNNKFKDYASMMLKSWERWLRTHNPYSSDDVSTSAFSAIRDKLRDKPEPVKELDQPPTEENKSLIEEIQKRDQIIENFKHYLMGYIGQELKLDVSEPEDNLVPIIKKKLEEYDNLVSKNKDLNLEITRWQSAVQDARENEEKILEELDNVIKQVKTLERENNICAKNLEKLQTTNRDLVTKIEKLEKMIQSCLDEKSIEKKDLLELSRNLLNQVKGEIQSKFKDTKVNMPNLTETDPKAFETSMNQLLGMLNEAIRKEEATSIKEIHNKELQLLKNNLVSCLSEKNEKSVSIDNIDQAISKFIEPLIPKELIDGKSTLIILENVGQFIKNQHQLLLVFMREKRDLEEQVKHLELQSKSTISPGITPSENFSKLSLFEQLGSPQVNTLSSPEGDHSECIGLKEDLERQNDLIHEVAKLLGQTAAQTDLDLLPWTQQIIKLHCTEQSNLLDCITKLEEIARLSINDKQSGDLQFNKTLELSRPLRKINDIAINYPSWDKGFTLANIEQKKYQREMGILARSVNSRRSKTLDSRIANQLLIKEECEIKPSIMITASRGYMLKPNIRAQLPERLIALKGESTRVPLLNRANTRKVDAITRVSLIKDTTREIELLRKLTPIFEASNQQTIFNSLEQLKGIKDKIIPPESDFINILDQIVTLIYEKHGGMDSFNKTLEEQTTLIKSLGPILGKYETEPNSEFLVRAQLVFDQNCKGYDGLLNCITALDQLKQLNTGSNQEIRTQLQNHIITSQNTEQNLLRAIDMLRSVKISSMRSVGMIIPQLSIKASLNGLVQVAMDTEKSWKQRLRTLSSSLPLRKITQGSPSKYSILNYDSVARPKSILIQSREIPEITYKATPPNIVETPRLRVAGAQLFRPRFPSSYESQLGLNILHSKHQDNTGSPVFILANLYKKVAQKGKLCQPGQGLIECTENLILLRKTAADDNGLLIKKLEELTTKIDACELKLNVRLQAENTCRQAQLRKRPPDIQRSRIELRLGSHLKELEAISRGYQKTLSCQSRISNLRRFLAIGATRPINTLIFPVNESSRNNQKLPELRRISPPPNQYQDFLGHQNMAKVLARSISQTISGHKGTSLTLSLFELQNLRSSTGENGKSLQSIIKGLEKNKKHAIQRLQLAETNLKMSSSTLKLRRSKLFARNDYGLNALQSRLSVMNRELSHLLSGSQKTLTVSDILLLKERRLELCQGKEDLSSCIARWKHLGEAAQGGERTLVKRLNTSLQSNALYLSGLESTTTILKNRRIGKKWPKLSIIPQSSNEFGRILFQTIQVGQCFDLPTTSSKWQRALSNWQKFKHKLEIGQAGFLLALKRVVKERLQAQAMARAANQQLVTTSGQYSIALKIRKPIIPNFGSIPNVARPSINYFAGTTSSSKESTLSTLEDENEWIDNRYYHKNPMVSMSNAINVTSAAHVKLGCKELLEQWKKGKEGNIIIDDSCLKQVDVELVSKANKLQITQIRAKQWSQEQLMAVPDKLLPYVQFRYWPLNSPSCKYLTRSQRKELNRWPAIRQMVDGICLD